MKVDTENVQFSEGLISIPNLNIFPYRKNNTKLAFTGAGNGWEYLANVTKLATISNNTTYFLPYTETYSSSYHYWHQNVNKHITGKP